LRWKEQKPASFGSSDLEIDPSERVAELPLMEAEPCDEQRLSMIDLRSQFAAARVLVFGDAMLDEYMLGTVSRISPEAPVPVVDIRTRWYVPGGAGNVAANVASLGAQVHLVAVCGRDGAGESLRRALSNSGVADSWLNELADRLTTCKTRVIAGQQQIVRFDNEHRSALSEEERCCMEKSFEAALHQSDVCIFSDYGKGIFSPELCGRAIALARSKGREVIVDPKGTDYSRYRGCTLITPNLREAGEAAGRQIGNEDELHYVGFRLMELLPGSSVLVTRGADGMTLFRPDQDPLTIPTVAQEVFDVVGAGDTVVATLGISIAARLPLETGTRLANVAAGIAVGRQGTVAVSIEELLSHPGVQEF
jgi:D-beta-D-heptose 7-phosphate kinase/D-beta-D-heptose 1-phosphate adenosyltransferase